MKQSELRHFAPLYSASRYFGAGKILLDWLGEDFRVLPLMLPHGVEYPGQFHEPIDIRRIEPIYWATNARLHSQALRIKPSVLIPHPLLLSPTFQNIGKHTRSGVLIIGAPPGRRNDLAMLESLREHGIRKGTILIKHRLGWQGSQAFWESHGYRTTTFDDPFNSTYNRMAKIFSGFDEIVSTTISSTLYFGAACGVKITLLRGCVYQAYELVMVNELMDLDNLESRSWLNRFADADAAEQQAMALEILGGDLRDRDRVREDLNAAIGQLEYPLFLSNPRYPRFLASTQAHLAIALDRPGIASICLPSFSKLWRGNEVGVLTMKLIDFSLDGPSPDNWSLKPVRYRRGLTEPGLAVDPYQ